MARVPLLTPQDVSEEHRALLEGMHARGGLINLYRAMANSPVALQRVYELLVTLWYGALSGRLREIAILSVVSASDAPYPLAWHIIDGEDAGLTTHEIRAVVNGDAAGVLAPDEAAVAAFARELTQQAQVSDATFNAVAAFMDEREIVELTLLAGLYRLVAITANGLAVDIDDEAAKRLEQFHSEQE